MKLNILLSRFCLGLLLASLILVSCKKGSDDPVAEGPMIANFNHFRSIGEELTITGSHFGASASDNMVKVNGAIATILSASTSSLSIEVPTGATSGKISVTVAGQTTTSVDDLFIVASLTTLAGNGTAGYAEGTGTAAQFMNPTDLVLDQAGNMYVTDGNHRIRKITPAGVVSTYAGNGDNAFADGPAASASFGIITGIAIDGAGNLYVADLGNYRVRKIATDGMVTTLAGNGTQGYINGAGNVAEFGLVFGVACNNNGDVYVVDGGNNVVRKISNNNVTLVAGVPDSSGFVNGPSLEAKFNNPIKIKIDAASNLIVLDQNNHCVRKISAAGVVSTIAGNGSVGISDGVAANAQFSYPDGLALDQAGNIYIGDQGNQRIRKISSDGNVTTVSGIGIIGNVNGNVNIASMHNPGGLDILPSGVFYVTDNMNHSIRKYTPAP